MSVHSLHAVIKQIVPIAFACLMSVVGHAYIMNVHHKNALGGADEKFFGNHPDAAKVVANWRACVLEPTWNDERSSKCPQPTVVTEWIQWRTVAIRDLPRPWLFDSAWQKPVWAFELDGPAQKPAR